MELFLTVAGTNSDFILGNLLRSGLSPWPYYDIAERAILDDINAAALSNTPFLGSALTGTATFDNNNERLTGVGTLFNSEVSIGACLIVAWNSTDGNGTGRHTGHVATRSDDTHLTFANFTAQIPTGQAGLTIYNCPTETATFKLVGGGFLELVTQIQVQMVGIIMIQFVLQIIEFITELEFQLILTMQELHVTFGGNGE